MGSALKESYIYGVVHLYAHPCNSEYGLLEPSIVLRNKISNSGCINRSSIKSTIMDFKLYSVVNLRIDDAEYMQEEYRR
jgi:hypothetical protein